MSKNSAQLTSTTNDFLPSLTLLLLVPDNRGSLQIGNRLLQICHALCAERDGQEKEEDEVRGSAQKKKILVVIDDVTMMNLCTHLEGQGDLLLNHTAVDLHVCVSVYVSVFSLSLCARLVLAVCSRKQASRENDVSLPVFFFLTIFIRCSHLFNFNLFNLRDRNTCSEGQEITRDEIDIDFGGIE
jgi:GTP cyclohydrolase I